MLVSIKKMLCAAAAVSAAFAVTSCAGGAAASGASSPEGGRPQSQRQAQAQARADAAAEKDYKSATKDIEKLNAARVNLRGLNIPCGIGAGTAATEAEALRLATEAARESVTESAGFETQGLSATYAHTVAAGPKKTWEDRVNQQAALAAAQAPVYKSVSQRNRAEGTYTVTALVILDPEVFKKILSDATFVNREFQQRAQNDRMMAKMDAVVKDFNSKYRKEQK